jgi:hypothetical protein
MNHYKEPDTVNMVNGRPVLNSSECNVSLGFLEGILNTRDGKALAELYENHVRVHGLINLEESTTDLNGSGFTCKRWL